MQIRRLVAAFALLLSPAVYAVDWSDPQTLVALAQANDPGLVRMRAEVAAARERVVPAAAQPNPMLMGGVQNKMIDLRDDDMMTMYMVGASQTFVSRDKRDARRSAAELTVASVEAQLASVQVEVERDVLFAWYDIAAIDEQLREIDAVRNLIDAIVGAARARYEVGSAAQSEVIRGQLEKSDLDHRVIELRGDRRNAVTKLLVSAGLPLDTVVPTIALPRAPSQFFVPRTDIPATHPALVALQSDVNALEQEIRLARLERKPDVNVEAQYGVRRTQRDMFSVVASVELPWRNKTIEPRVREAIAMRDAAQSRIEELRRTLTRDIGIAASAQQTAHEQMKFHEEVLVPQAQLAFESTLAAYQAGRSSLDAALSAESDYLRLQLDDTNYLAQHHKATHDLAALRNGARAGALGTAKTGGME